MPDSRRNLDATRRVVRDTAVATTHPARRDAELVNLERLAWFLDSSVALPGGFRIGADSLIGLIPGIGDAAGALVSAYIMAQGFRLGATPSVFLRMGMNVALDLIVGAIPVIGDLFDMAFRANRRNVELLAAYSTDDRRTTARSRLLLIAVVFGVLVAAALLVWSLLSLFALVWRSIVV